MLLATSTGCLNPEFVNQLGVALPFNFGPQLYPVAPGNEPFIMVRIINDTSSTIDVALVYDTGTAQPVIPVTDITPGFRETGLLLNWPITRLGMGNLNNPFSIATPAIVAELPDGGTSTVAFGRQTLLAGTDFARGDTVVFQVTEDPRSPAVITISVGRIRGATQPSFFTRANPFEAVRLILALEGF